MICLENFVGKREILNLNVFSHFCSGDSTSSSIENELKTITLRVRKFEKERAPIVKFIMNERGSNNYSSCVQIESAPNSPEIKLMRRFTESRNMLN